jgi:hypothetical protein
MKRDPATRLVLAFAHVHEELVVMGAQRDARTSRSFAAKGSIRKWLIGSVMVFLPSLAQNTIRPTAAV